MIHKTHENIHDLAGTLFSGMKNRLELTAPAFFFLLCKSN
jgi:hypothetical protein